MVKRRKLAVSDSEDDGEGSSRSIRLKSSRRRANSARGRDEASSGEEVDKLVDNSQASLLEKPKSKERSGGKNGRAGKKNGKEREAVSRRSTSSRSGSDDVGGVSEVASTMSPGSDHKSDDEEGLGAWNDIDRRCWQMKAEDDDVCNVDIVIRWRWHSRRHFCQYRVKWEGYSDYHNSWLPYENFDGDLVDEFWSDIEFAKVGSRPEGWRDGTDEGKDIHADSEDTEAELVCPDQSKRKAARRRKRRDIRVDRVEMREAYARKEKRSKAERKAKDAELERMAEERRLKRRKEKEEEEAKRAPASTKRRVIQVGNQVRPTSKPSGGSSSAPLTADHTSQDGPSVVKRSDEQLEYARSFLLESDAKLKAERRKAKMAEEGGLDGKQGQDKAAGVPSTTMQQGAPSSASLPSKVVSRGPGSFRGAHKAPSKVAKWDPLGTGQSPSTSTAAAAAAATKSITRAAPPVASADGTSQAPIAVANEDKEVRVDEASAPTANLPPTLGPFATSYRPPAGPAVARGAIRTGHDPRSRPGQAAMTARAPAASQTDTPVEPTSLLSPLSHAASPLHFTSLPSPREEVEGPMPSRREQQPVRLERAIKPVEREKAVRKMAEWKMSAKVLGEIGHSYNVVADAGNESVAEKRKTLDMIVSINGGGVRKMLDDKLKEPERKVIVWVPSLEMRLTKMEREALLYDHVRFYYYGSAGSHEIWPSKGGKVVMYTFGALVLKLVEQCYREEKDCAWPEPNGTAVFVHPWQKAVLEKLLNTDRVSELLQKVAGIHDDSGRLGDIDFSIVDKGMRVLEDVEEVPWEHTHCSEQDADAKELDDQDLEHLALTLDEEVSRTLHKMQQAWRTDKRSFTLVMARTRLESASVSTSYVIQ